MRYDVASGNPLTTIVTGQGEPFRLAATRDGRRLLTGSYFDGTARLWDTETGKAIGPPLKQGGMVAAVAFSPDGKVALTGSDNQTTRLWDAATGLPLGEPKRHGTGILAAAFSPDGRTIVTGGRNGAAQLWDAATWEARGTPLQQQGAVEAVLFSPDGRVVVTGGKDGRARLWHAASGKPIGPVMRHGAMISALAWRPQGGMLVTGSDDSSLIMWVPPGHVADELEPLVRWTQVITGLEIDEHGTFRVMEPAAWNESRAALTKLQEQGKKKPWQLPSSRHRAVPVPADDKVHDVGDGGLTLSGNLGKVQALGYRVRLLAGKAYVIDMVSPNAKALDPFLRFLDAGGKQIAQDDDGGEDRNARIGYTVEETAVYQIVATEFKENGTGPFTLTVRPGKLDRAWQNEQRWVLQGNELFQQDVNGGRGYFFGDPAWTDYDFEVDVQTLGGDNEIDIAFRAVNRKNYHYVALGGYQNTRHAVLSKRANASNFSLLTSVLGKTSRERWYRVRLEARGSRFKVFLDGEPLMDFQSNRYLRGAVGVWGLGTSARFRNPKVTAPDGKVLLEGWDVK